MPSHSVPETTVEKNRPRPLSLSGPHPALPAMQPLAPMVCAAALAYVALFGEAGCSSCQGTSCAPLPSPFMVTAQPPLALGPTQSCPEKAASDANGVPSLNGSVAIATTSAIVEVFEVVEMVRVVRSFLSVTVIGASNCKDPSCDAM